MGMMFSDDKDREQVTKKLAAQVAKQRGQGRLPTTIPAAIFLALLALAIFLFWRF